MFTASDARRAVGDDLDERIAYAVRNNRSGDGAYMRIYIEDPWCRRIESELEARGFINIDVPDITLKGDVYFEWPEKEED
jgi:hypothetical protein